MHLLHGPKVKLSRNERALDALGSKKCKNVGYLTRARLERRKVPSTVAGRRISPLPCFSQISRNLSRKFGEIFLADFPN